MNPNPTVEDAVARLRAIKVEHRALLDVIARDPGMTPDTRRALISHVLDEEEEQVGRIEARLGDGSHTQTATPERASTARGLSVGSLRHDPLPPTNVRGTVGSLRRE